MKKLATLIVLTLVLASCGTDSHHFKIDGRLLNINQGEFYVYSLDGGLEGVDTIKVQAGRFAYEIPCEETTTLMIVFPNFLEQPIFAKPGASVDVKGDASHLKELKVTGTKDNELMNRFREQVVNASPPEARKYAEQFIKDHPESVVGAYLVTKYFIQTAQPDYKKALRLINTMLAKQDRNGYLKRVGRALQGMAGTAIGNSLSAFSATDVKGQPVSKATINAPVAVINVWASWDFESTDNQRELKRQQASSHGKLKVLSICLDGNKSTCKEAMRRDSITWPNVCDGEMMDGRLFRQFGFSSVPDNIILQNGRIVARGLRMPELHNRLQQLVK
jgi:hypothetical protein